MLFFLKIILRCLKLGINIIYIDECGFFTQNSNYYSWRKFSQEKYHKIKDNKKFNLIMAVSSNTINHFKINDSSTTSLEFKEFMKELISKLTAYEKSNSLFVFDNLTSHLTDEMFQFYYENKLKVLLNVPYQSKFNMIELAFREIKNITYKRLYSDIVNLKKDVKKIIISDMLRNSLGKLFRETLVVYKKYINLYLNYDLHFGK